MKKFHLPVIAAAAIFLHNTQAVCETLQINRFKNPAVQSSQEAMTLKTKWPELKTFYVEPFSDIRSINRSIWLIGSDMAAWKGSVADGVYQLENCSDQNAVKYSFAKIKEINPENDAVSVDAGMDAEMKGPYSRIGLVYRLNPADKTYFAFVLAGGKNYAFAKRDAKGYREILRSSSESVKPGKLNRLGIIGKGPAMVLYINGSIVKLVKDSSLKGNNSGTIAISTGKFYLDNFSLGKTASSKPVNPEKIEPAPKNPGNDIRMIDDHDGHISVFPSTI